jgi:hypothetical protein
MNRELTLQMRAATAKLDDAAHAASRDAASAGEVVLQARNRVHKDELRKLKLIVDATVECEQRLADLANAMENHRRGA